LTPKGVELPESDDTVGRTVAFITVLGEVVPAAFAMLASESKTTVIGGGGVIETDGVAGGVLGVLGVLGVTGAGLIVSVVALPAACTNV
jgi:hypothetical protein